MSRHAISDSYEQNKTYVIGPFDSRLKFGQTEVNLNTEHDRPVLVPTLTRHGLGARGQWGQISTFIATGLTLPVQDPLWLFPRSTVTPGLDLKDGEH